MSTALYLCDRQKCKYCSYPLCAHTTDIEHAVNFKKVPDHDVYAEDGIEVKEGAHDNNTGRS